LLSADVKEDGSFSLQTDGLYPGAPPGTYQVYFGADAANEYEKKPVAVAKKQRSAETTELSYEVLPESNSFEIKVEKP
jgi:hypothetical protein